MHVMEALRQLRDADQEWVIKGQEYSALRERLNDQSALTTRQKAQAQREGELDQTRRQLNTTELELHSIQTRAQEVDRQLYADGNLSPRELDHLRRDTEYLKRQISDVEERVIELMTRQEELSAAAAQEADALAAFEANWTEERATDMARFRELRAALQALKERREMLRGAIAPQTLALYDDLWRSRQGAPLTTMIAGHCQACHVAIPRDKARTVESYESRVVTCDGCGRILIIS